MTPYTQLNLHNPKEGLYGDCARTAIACILDMEPSTVPHWYDGVDTIKQAEAAHRQMRDWLQNLGYDYLAIAYNYFPSIALTLEFFSSLTRGYYMLCGESGNGVNHIVVCKGNEIIWDPSQDKSGIIGPADDGAYWFEMIYKPLT